MSVVLALATYRRPRLLAALLPQLLDQALTVPGTSVVVVDNDPEASARPVAARWPSVHYRHEPRPGIAAARNRAIHTARAIGATAIVFLDDDEEPTAGWLAALVTVWERTGCAAVCGPVVSVFAEPVDEWTAAAKVFQRRRTPTGTPRAGAATNNLLLDLEVLAAERLAFDDRFGLTGGSDTLLTRTLTGRGHKILWCDEAVVTEVVPPERSNRSWVLRRSARTGNVWSRVHLELAGRRRARTRMRLLTLGLGHYVRGAARLLIGRLRADQSRRVEGATDVATGTGVIRGAVGGTVIEYVRTPKG